MIAVLAGTGLLTAPARAGEGAKLDPSLVPMDEIAVPILDGARMQGVLRFTLVLRARDAVSASQVAQRITSLRSTALLTGLDFARLRASPYRAVDVAQLALDLDEALKKADSGVEQALIVRVGATVQ